mgnify:CR=1 FL=1
MSYHGTSSSSPAYSTGSSTNLRGQIAPIGYHYMPDGTLMLNSAMDEEVIRSEESLLNDILITGFEMDLSALVAAGEARSFTVTGDAGAIFELVIKNEDAAYYNFYTRAFQVKKSFLKKELLNDGIFVGSVQFPLVTDDDQYDISITAVGKTQHDYYREVRFGDGSLDINLTKGSNSLLMTKVIYQYVDLVLTISPYSPTAAITATLVSDTIAVSSGIGLVNGVDFEVTVTVANDKALRIIKQPTHLDITAHVGPVIGSAPINIPGENIYPTATAAFTGDDVNGAVTSGVTVDTDATDISARIAVGDKVTTPVTTDTVDGNVGVEGTALSDKVVMDNNVATKMAIGDQVTGNAFLDANLVTVKALDPDGDNAKEFALSEAVPIFDGITLTFSSKVNRSLTTVTIFPLDASAFAISQAIQFRDNAPLVFFNQMNYRWPIDNFAHVVKPGFHMFAGSPSNLVDNSVLADYQDTTTVFAGTEQEKIYINYEVPAVSSLYLKPSITRGEITTQAGAITFDKQQPLLLAGDTMRAGGYGQGEIFNCYGYDLVFSNLNIELTPVTTTTTAAVNGSTSVPVTSRNGILDDVSTVSGIGIDPSAVDPTVDTGAGAVSGAGTLVLTAAQTLEDGATLAFANAGLVATITGSVQVLKAGTSSQTVRIDIEKLLSIT